MLPVLVVDQDKQRLAGTAAVLSGHGYCPLEACSAGDAVALLHDMPVEVAVVACSPSRGDSVALVDAIRRERPCVAVIAMVEDDPGRRPSGPSALDRLDVAAIVPRRCPPGMLIHAVGGRLLAAQAA